MAEPAQTELLVLTEHDQELKQFFDKVRAVGQLAVKDGEHEFVVEYRRVSISAEARRLLTKGGPG